jgi:hypothetical protein
LQRRRKKKKKKKKKISRPWLQRSPLLCFLVCLSRVCVWVFVTERERERERERGCMCMANGLIGVRSEWRKRAEKSEPLKENRRRKKPRRRPKRRAGLGKLPTSQLKGKETTREDGLKMKRNGFRAKRDVDSVHGRDSWSHGSKSNVAFSIKRAPLVDSMGSRSKEVTQSIVNHIL